MIKLITREKLEKIARTDLKYTLQDAEKDYFLALVMYILSKNKLANKLVFKGGTSIYHCYLDQYRFSEDLAFISLDKNLELNEIEDVFAGYDIFEIKKTYSSKATIKIERLKYNGVLDTPNSIKFEVDRFQNVYLDPLKRKYKNKWGLDFTVNVMNPVEICAEKIRACSDRFRYRDFYDLYLMVKEVKIDINESINLIPKKEIRKQISKEKILRNLELSLEEKLNEGDTVLYSEEIDSLKLKDFFKSLKLDSFEPNV